MDDPQEGATPARIEVLIGAAAVVGASGVMYLLNVLASSSTCDTLTRSAGAAVITLIGLLAAGPTSRRTEAMRRRTPPSG
ncbi:hypothetical protein AB2L28_09145 [Kineococcus sp. TBRC 1896]|uniref:Uncharacterized protein n=1 Tax=Kineococcus mangrovi TaxID=1660183 RepID=A0ABV4I161_9ACTN